VFKEKAPKPAEGSLGGVDKDRKLSAVKNYSTKFSEHIKNAMSATTSSPVAPVT
jgi:hypothetical protein